MHYVEKYYIMQKSLGIKMSKNKGNKLRFTEEQYKEMLLKTSKGIKNDIDNKQSIPSITTQSTSEKNYSNTRVLNMTNLEFNSLTSEEKLQLAHDYLNVKPKKSKSKKAINQPDNNELVKEFLGEKEEKVKKAKGIDVKTIINEINECKVLSSHSETHFSLLFDGARLLSVNQIFAILQYRKYEIFGYKKAWQKIIKDEISKLKDLPYFTDSVELTLFRQSPRLVDEDALGVMFKFIIDALKTDKKDNFKGIIAEDNPKIVQSIKLEQEKGPNFIGIKIKDISQNNKKEKFTPNNILEQ